MHKCCASRGLYLLAVIGRGLLWLSVLEFVPISGHWRDSCWKGNAYTTAMIYGLIDQAWVSQIFSCKECKTEGCVSLSPVTSLHAETILLLQGCIYVTFITCFGYNIVQGGEFLAPACICEAGCSQTLNPGWARKEYFLIFPNSSLPFVLNFNLFSSSIWFSRWAKNSLPTREGPSYPTAYMRLWRTASRESLASPGLVLRCEDSS